MERLCKNCKHFDGYSHCGALAGRPNMIHGGDLAPDGVEVSMARVYFCGWNDPKLWEPRLKAVDGGSR